MAEFDQRQQSDTIVNTPITTIFDENGKMNLGYFNWYFQMRIIPKVGESANGFSEYSQELSKNRQFVLTKERAWELHRYLRENSSSSLAWESRKGTDKFKISKSGSVYSIELDRNNAGGLKFNFNEKSYNRDMLLKCLDAYLSPLPNSFHFQKMRSHRQPSNSPSSYGAPEEKGLSKFDEESMDF